MLSPISIRLPSSLLRSIPINTFAYLLAMQPGTYNYTHDAAWHDLHTLKGSSHVRIDTERYYVLRCGKHSWNAWQLIQRVRRNGKQSEIRTETTVEMESVYVKESVRADGFGVTYRSELQVLGKLSDLEKLPLLQRAEVEKAPLLSSEQWSFVDQFGGVESRLLQSKAVPPALQEAWVEAGRRLA